MKKNIIIIILFLGIVGMAGYITYDKIFKESSSEEVKEEQEETTTAERVELSLDDTLVQYLYDMIDMPSGPEHSICGIAKNVIEQDTKVYAEDLTSEQKISLATNIIPNKYREENVSCSSYPELSSNVPMSDSSIDENAKFCPTDYYTVRYDEDTIKKYVEWIFGKGSYQRVETTRDYSDVLRYLYFADDGNYVGYKGPMVCGISVRDSQILRSAYQENDTVVLTYDVTIGAAAAMETWYYYTYEVVFKQDEEGFYHFYSSEKIAEEQEVK